MEKIREIDNSIKQALLFKANAIELSAETFPKILAGIKKSQTQGRLQLGFKNYIAVVACLVIIIFGGSLALSVNARASAMEIIETIKTVFILDKNNNIVEKPTDYAFLQPAYSNTSLLSDSDISKKMGMQVFFPKTIAPDFNLTFKGEAVGFRKILNYETYRSLESDTIRAIDDEQVFKSLAKYQPYRSVGASYKNSKGDLVYVAIYNKKISIPRENFNIKETIQTKVGTTNAEWFHLSYPDYPNDDLTQKPVGEASVHLLLWSTNNTTYEILLKSDNTFSMEKVVKIAETFMNAPK